MKIIDGIKKLENETEKLATETWKIKVKHLKATHSFTSQFLLEKSLIEVVRKHAYLKHLYEQISTPNDLKIGVKNLQSAFTRITNAINTSPPELIALLDRYARPTTSITTEEITIADWNHEKYLNDSKQALLALDLIQNILPKVKTGHNPHVSNKDVIRMLIKIFEDGTGKKVTQLTKNGRKNLYLDKKNNNEVVLFIINVEPLLIQIGLTIDNDSLGEESTISTLINKILKERNLIS